ncbi:MAG: hypothetical protein ACC682_14835 [Gemmatimonadota bacterium]
MSKRSWLLVAVVLGAGILLQIPSWGWGDHGVDVQERGAMMGTDAAASDQFPGTQTVFLDVTGMT